MKYRHIFFDLDNTLWDHRKNAKLTIQDLFIAQKVGEKYSLGFEDFHHRYHITNEKLWEDIRDGKITKEYLREHRFRDTFLYFGIDNIELADYFEHHFFNEIVRYNEMMPNALEILSYLKSKGYRLHIISNGFNEETRRKIKGAEIGSYFDSVTSADEIGIRKPAPQIYEHAFAKSDAKKEESMMIGDDWIADALGAQKFGIASVFYDVLAEAKSAPEILTIKDLLELKEIL